MAEPDWRKRRMSLHAQIALLISPLLVVAWPFIHAYLILGIASQPPVDVPAVEAKLASLRRQETGDLVGRSFFTPSGMAQSPSGNRRDEEMLQQRRDLWSKMRPLEEELRRERRRQTFIEKKPVAYLYMAFGTILLGLWCLLLRFVLRRYAREAAAAGFYRRLSEDA